MDCRWIAALAVIFATLTPVSLPADEPVSPVYELRTYVCEPGKLPALEERFRDHTLRIFEKHGMKNLAYWKPAEGPESETTLIYLLEHASREAADKSWAAFRADPEWKQVAADSQAKYGKILARSPDSVFLVRTDYSPVPSLPEAGLFYEIRTYTCPPGKIHDLNARFRDHTNALFRKHRLGVYGYWSPTDSPRSEDTLIYVTFAPSQQASDASWAAFRADPEWKLALAESEKNGSLTASKPVSIPLILEPFSPTRK